MMMTKPDAEKIAQDAHAARPEWDTAGIMAALLKVRDRDPRHVRAAALHAARNPANRTPAVIALDGEHWTATAPRPTPQRGKCATHDLAYIGTCCPSCRADDLAGGREAPTVTRRHYAAEPAGVPMPDWFREFIRSGRRDLA